MPARFRLRFVALALQVLICLPSPAQGQLDQPEEAVVVRALADMMSDALRHALALRTSELDVRAADAAHLAATGVFDPRLFLSPSFGRSDGRSVANGLAASSLLESGGVTTSLSGLLPWSTSYSVILDSQMSLEDPVSTQIRPRQWNNALSVSLTQPLLQGFGGAAGADDREAAALGFQAARARHARQVEMLLAEVEASYFELARRDAEELAALASLERARTLLARNEELRVLQRISEIDLLSSRSGVAQRRSSVLQARRLRRDAADRLVSLVYGEEAPGRLERLAPYLHTEELEVALPELPSPAESADLAVRRRPDVRASRLDVARQEMHLGTARNRLLPDLSLGATYTALGSNTTNALQFGAGRNGEFASAGWSASITFSLPVLNAQDRGLFEQSRALARQSEFFMVAVENLARVDARIAHRGVTIGEEMHGEALEALALAQAHYEGEEQRRQLGLSDSFRLLQVEEEVAAAEQAEIAARFGLLAAVTQYELAVGGTLLEKYDVPERFLPF